MDVIRGTPFANNTLISTYVWPLEARRATNESATASKVTVQSTS